MDKTNEKNEIIYVNVADRVQAENQSAASASTVTARLKGTNQPVKKSAKETTLIANVPEEEKKQDSFIIADDSILNKPLHDTGSTWYAILSLFLPIVGIILAPIFKKYNYISNYKVCKKWSIISFIIIGSLIALFFLVLLTALI